MQNRPEDWNVDILLRPKAAYALVVLHLYDKPVSTTELKDMLEYGAPVSAANLRDYLIWHGLAKTLPERLYVRIELTEKGHKTAQDLLNARKRTHGDAWQDTEMA